MIGLLTGKNPDLSEDFKVMDISYLVEIIDEGLDLTSLASNVRKLSEMEPSEIDAE